MEYLVCLFKCFSWLTHAMQIGIIFLDVKNKNKIREKLGINHILEDIPYIGQNWEISVTISWNRFGIGIQNS